MNVQWRGRSERAGTTLLEFRRFISLLALFYSHHTQTKIASTPTSITMASTTKDVRTLLKIAVE